jgi:hypothetical protein
MGEEGKRGRGEWGKRGRGEEENGGRGDRGIAVNLRIFRGNYFFIELSMF